MNRVPKTIALALTSLTSASLMTLAVTPAQAESCTTSPNGMRVHQSTAGLTQWRVAGQRFWTASGPATDTLKSFVTRFNNEVEFIGDEANDDWSWNINSTTDSGRCSNHASGTAVDLNATRHPMYEKGTFSAKQMKALRKLINSYNGHIVWGGDWTNPVDEMHFEYRP